MYTISEGIEVVIGRGNTMEFSERLKELRKQRGLSQYELAKNLGISKSTISMMEIGSRQPSKETMEMIADYFNVSLDFLTGKENLSYYYFEPSQSDLLVKLAGDEELYALVEKILNGSKEQRDRLIQMAKLMEIK